MFGAGGCLPALDKAGLGSLHVGEKGRKGVVAALFPVAICLVRWGAGVGLASGQRAVGDCGLLQGSAADCGEFGEVGEHRTGFAWCTSVAVVVLVSLR